jgi:hypothetical protein
MRFGSILVLTAASVAVYCVLDNRGILRGQQSEPAAKPSAPALPVQQDAQAAKAEETPAVIGPAGFPYSVLMPVEPVAAFKERGFKVGVVAYFVVSDLTNRVNSEHVYLFGPLQHRITFSMGSEKRTADLDSNFRLIAVAEDGAKELDATKLTTAFSKEGCLITLESRGGEEKVTQICILSEKAKDRQEIVKINQELQNHIDQWQRALINDASQGHKLLTPKQVKQGKESIAMAEHRLMVNAMDGDGDGMRFHTRGGLKTMDVENRKVTLAQGGQERTWNVAKEAKVFVVMVHFSEDVFSRICGWNDAYSRVIDRSPYSVTQANEGMARLRSDSQVYLTFDGKGKVERIDIMEQQRLVLPDMPWLPFPMIDAGCEARSTNGERARTEEGSNQR